MQSQPWMQAQCRCKAGLLAWMLSPRPRFTSSLSVQGHSNILIVNEAPLFAWIWRFIFGLYILIKRASYIPLPHLLMRILWQTILILLTKALLISMYTPLKKRIQNSKRNDAHTPPLCLQSPFWLYHPMALVIQILLYYPSLPAVLL